MHESSISGEPVPKSSINLRGLMDSEVRVPRSVHPSVVTDNLRLIERFWLPSPKRRVKSPPSSQAQPVQGRSVLGAESALAAAATLRVALLTNSLSPHSVALCEQISLRVREFRAFLSSDTDRYHKFPRVRASFRITIQRSINWLRPLRRAHGFWQSSELHVPYDTFYQLQGYRPNLILTVQLGLRTALAILYRRRNPGTKVVLWATLSQHTEAERGRARRVLRRWIIRHIDGAFVNGRQGEQYLRQLGYAGPLERVPYAIDDSLFRSDVYQPKRRQFRMLYAGQLVSQKGLRLFCTVLARWCVEHPGTRVEFVLLGDGPQASILRALRCPPNLRLSVLPGVPQSKLAAHYRSADVFAFPTLGDEWGVVINEAMSAGLPVLGSVFSQAVMELVEDESAGWLFDPQQECSIYEALDRTFACTVEELKMKSECARRKIAEFAPSLIGERATRFMGKVWRENA